MTKPRLQWDRDERTWILVPILNKERSALIKNS